MEAYKSTRTETIGGDWSITGIVRQAVSLKVPGIGEVPADGVVSIDCSAVEQIDYSGFQLLYIWLQLYLERGLRCELVNMPESMRKEQVRLGLDRVLPAYYENCCHS